MRKCGLPMLGVLVVALAGLPGCQRISQERKQTLGPGDVKSLLIDAPRYAQKIKVEVASPGVPVDAYVVFDEHAQKAQDALLGNQKPADVLAGKEKVEKAELEASIPAGKAYAVI